MTPFNSPILYLAASFLLLAASGGRLAFAQEPSALQLAPQAEVDSGGIFLPQIVTPGSQPPPQIRLADAPALGAAMTLSRDQVASLLRKSDPQLAANWSGAQSIRITRRTRLLAEAELLPLLSQALQSDPNYAKGEIELRLTRAWTPITIPDEAVVAKLIDLPSTGLSPSMILRFELRGAGDEFVGTWQVSVQIKLWCDAWVARYPLKRGQTLSSGDLALERVDALTVRGAVTGDFLSVGAFELIDNVPAGRPLLSRSIRLKPAVYRGQMIEAVLQEGLLSVSLKVEVLEDGLPGQLVRVRNLQTKREFRGKVQNEQMVLLTL